MKYTIPAVIFAGGKSSRMGRDKALLPFGEYPTLAEYQYRKMQNIFESVYLSAKKNKFAFPAELICDRYEASSPLAGIVSAFETLDTDALFVLSVDAPFITEKVIAALFEANRKNTDAVIAKSPDGIQPLCGIYKRSLLPFAKQQLLDNKHRLTSLLKQNRSRFIAFQDNTPFENLNHPHEYEAAIRRSV
ncbi:Molybdopterin-guanine dinucleotide biosynthesis protein MobA [hydrothermal vent metagenome]|uniref:Molybdopterin-guanine dinucleotide biosynthesis protein MobA n=1 Tax=hydrothermal vent metagenome TaxID=652676 RepID=A0A1W1BSM4_9ZZZZ